VNHPAHDRQLELHPVEHDLALAAPLPRRDPEHEREIDLTERFTVVIKKTMDEMIPMNNILLNLMADDEDTFNFHEEEAAAEEERFTRLNMTLHSQ
jgi:hypothetical protein